MSDTYAEVDADLKEQFGEGFELFEVCRDPKNGYCRILQCFSDLCELETEAKEGEERTIITPYSEIQVINSVRPKAISHLSTWILVRDPEAAALMKKHCMGPSHMAIRLKI